MIAPHHPVKSNPPALTSLTLWKCPLTSACHSSCCSETFLTDARPVVVQESNAEAAIEALSHFNPDQAKVGCEKRGTRRAAGSDGGWIKRGRVDGSGQQGERD
eukprot:1383049-Rhodomonas_salina.2